MSRTYEIFKTEDLETVFHKLREYEKLRESKGLPYQKLSLVCKRWVKPKSSLQHRKYFALIGKLKPLFLESGYQVNENDINGFLKAKMGFTRCIDGVIFVKSISDLSEDASSKVLNDLIEFTLQYGAESFGVDLESDRCIA